MNEIYKNANSLEYSLEDILYAGVLYNVIKEDNSDNYCLMSTRICEIKENDILKKLAGEKGIYAFYRDCECLYVGKSIDLLSRLGSGHAVFSSHSKSAYSMFHNEIILNDDLDALRLSYQNIKIKIFILAHLIENKFDLLNRMSDINNINDIINYYYEDEKLLKESLSDFEKEIKKELCPKYTD